MKTYKLPFDSVNFLFLPDVKPLKASQLKLSLVCLLRVSAVDVLPSVKGDYQNLVSIGVVHLQIARYLCSLPLGFKKIIMNRALR